MILFATVKHRYYQDVDTWKTFRYDYYDSKKELKSVLERSGFVIKDDKIYNEEEEKTAELEDKRYAI